MVNQVSNLEKYIEHTILKPEATLGEVKILLDEAINYKFLGVCINPVYVRFAKEYLKDSSVKVVTVIGFPLGANTSIVKGYEAKKAVEDGADELDMVINIGAIKDKDYKKAEADIKAVVDNSGGNLVKVILETDLLTKEEIVEACKVSMAGGANFVKTSTGFVKGGVGATAENVKLMYNTVSSYGLEVKASGGV
ncbi:MAG TPA: deoxyribose-phosphate aldolase, partial [Cyanobacteria bacterium UBA9579]|nr:deoxyribose-phosphate aldolase [Cyanobacteria bacterium UBA9579]